MKKTIITLVVICLVFTLVAEPLKNKLSVFNEDDAKAFLQPLANTMGAGMNSGTYTTAKVLKPLMPSFRVGTTFALVPSSEKSFYTSGYLNNVETATIFGTSVGEITGYVEDIVLPKGADISLVPIPQMMISLGLPFGNEVMFRGWFETNISSEIGDIAFWGVGLKHSIDQYLGRFFPIDMSVLGFYQKMDVADFISVETFSANFAVSKSILMFTLYGGVGYEQANLEAKYVYDLGIPGVPAIETKLDFKAKNDFSGTVGARIVPFPFVSVFADYTFAHTSTINFGIGVGF